jgi:hypothetical protein
MLIPVGSIRRGIDSSAARTFALSGLPIYVASIPVGSIRERSPGGYDREITDGARGSCFEGQGSTAHQKPSPQKNIVAQDRLT